MVEVEFEYLSIDVKTNDFVIILRRRDNGRQLPIWIGSAEAFSIAIAMVGIEPPRPMTHDLLIDVVTALGAKLARVVISGLRDSTFYALLHIERGDVETYVVDARPSDSIALALRAKCDIIMSDDIETFNLEFPDNETEKELSERLRKVEPQEMIGF